jgi:hypothetical protein
MSGVRRGLGKLRVGSLGLQSIRLGTKASLLRPSGDSF